MQPREELTQLLTKAFEAARESGALPIENIPEIALERPRDEGHGDWACTAALRCAKEAKKQENPQAFLAEKEEEYTEMFANPYQAAQYGYIDDVIEPRNTRFRICRGLAQLATKRQSLPAKKHGCMPM